MTPYNVIRNALKSLRGYNLPLTKPMWEEDVIADRLNEDVCRERMIKYRDVASFEKEMRKSRSFL